MDDCLVVCCFLVIHSKLQAPAHSFWFFPLLVDLEHLYHLRALHLKLLVTTIDIVILASQLPFTICTSISWPNRFSRRHWVLAYGFILWMVEYQIPACTLVPLLISTRTWNYFTNLRKMGFLWNYLGTKSQHFLIMPDYLSNCITLRKQVFCTSWSYLRQVFWPAMFTCIMSSLLTITLDYQLE